MPTFLTKDDPNAHSEFVTWIEANQDGFFINRKGQKEMMLHSARRSHLKPYDWANQTTNLKACSKDRKKIDHWAQVESDSLDVCNDCM